MSGQSCIASTSSRRTTISGCTNCLATNNAALWGASVAVADYSISMVSAPPSSISNLEHFSLSGQVSDVFGSVARGVSVASLRVGVSVTDESGTVTPLLTGSSEVDVDQTDGIARFTGISFRR